MEPDLGVGSQSGFEFKRSQSLEKRQVQLADVKLCLPLPENSGWTDRSEPTAPGQGNLPLVCLKSCHLGVPPREHGTDIGEMDGLKGREMFLEEAWLQLDSIVATN